MLKNAIDDCERFDKLHDNKEVKNANRTLAVIEARQGDYRHYEIVILTYTCTLPWWWNSQIENSNFMSF